MRKATKLGYCATCNEEVFIFDMNGRPFAKRTNYREILCQLSDGSMGAIAFCDKCVENGIDAEEAIQNCIDGLESDLSSKEWTPEFKEWYLAPKRELKIMGFVSVKKLSKQGEVLEEISTEERDKISPFKKVYEGDFITPTLTPPPAMRVPNVSPN